VKKILLTILALLLTTQTAFAYNFSLRVANPLTDKKTWFELSANQGQTLEDSLLVTNKSKDPLTLNIYSTDASHNADTGSFHAGHTDEIPKTLGQWTQISPQTISLTPFQTKEIPFTITVPEELENGEYYGAIMASPVLEGNNSSGTTIQTRLGARIYLTVEKAAKEIDFINLAYISGAVTMLLIMALIFWHFYHERKLNAI
jgi:hypothetical protein